MGIHIALIHHPVYDKAGDRVATNITNFDIHDISRIAKTFGVCSYNIIHPNWEQLAFVERTIEHWTTGYGKKFNQKRGESLSILRGHLSLEALLKELNSPRVYATSARDHSSPVRVSYSHLRDIYANAKADQEDFLILFGTGYGLTEEILNMAEGLLEPIQGLGPSGFNHLPVRASVGVILDRILGEW